MSRNVITSVELIQRYSRDRERDDMSFRSFVKFRLDMDDSELDAIVWQTTDEVWAQIDCRQCANCCRTLQIVVDELDIERLAARTLMKPAEFRRKYVARTDGEMHLTSPPCPFLEGNLCTVYEDRPRACRDFPYLHQDGFRQRMLMMIENSELCPIVFNTLDRLKRRLRPAHGARGRRR